VFYRGRAPSGTKTQWKMNEYRALQYDDDVGGRTADGSSSSAHATATAAQPSLPPQVTLERSSND
jgi:hypothetical protein